MRLKVLAKIHYARRVWNCVLCPETIDTGDPYRYVYPEGRKKVAHAHVKCSDPIVREQVIQQFAGEKVNINIILDLRNMPKPLKKEWIETIEKLKQMLNVKVIGVKNHDAHRGKT